MEEKRENTETKNEKNEEQSVQEKKSPKKRALKQQKAIEKLKEEKKQLETKIDRLQRTMADVDNLRKRTERDKERIKELAAEKIHIERLLPIIDDIERFLAQPDSQENCDAFRKGVEMIYNKFFKALQDAGVKPMETDGKKFDPEKHWAIMQVESDEVPSNHIIQTLEKGYYLNDKVFRHAKVCVSR